MTPEKLFNIEVSDFELRKIKDEIEADPGYRQYVADEGECLIEEYQACHARFLRLFEVLQPEVYGANDENRRVIIDIGPSESPATGRGNVVARVQQLNFNAEPSPQKRSGFVVDFIFISDHNSRWRLALERETFNDRYEMLKPRPGDWSRDHFGEAVRYHMPRIEKAEDTLLMLEQAASLEPPDPLVDRAMANLS